MTNGLCKCCKKEFEIKINRKYFCSHNCLYIFKGLPFKENKTTCRTHGVMDMTNFFSSYNEKKGRVLFNCKICSRKRDKKCRDKAKIIPEKYEKVIGRKKRYVMRSKENISDTFIKNSYFSRTYIPRSEIPENLIEAYRELYKLKLKLKELKKWQ